MEWLAVEPSQIGPRSIEVMENWPGGPKEYWPGGPKEYDIWKDSGKI